MQNILEDTLKKTALDHGSSVVFNFEGVRLTPNPAKGMTIEVTSEKSQDAALRFRGRQVTILNFASAVTPGGGVRYGFHAQEEDLCLCSGLLHELEKLVPHFESNRSKKTPFGGYDKMIISDNVPLIKNGDYQDVKQQRVRVISYSAPCIDDQLTPTLAAEIVSRRTKQIVSRASALGTEVLILGAWGCGEYGNDPVQVASAFKEALHFFGGAIQHVVFPIFGGGLKQEVFEEVFEEGAKDLNL